MEGAEVERGVGRRVVRVAACCLAGRLVINRLPTLHRRAGDAKDGFLHWPTEESSFITKKDGVAYVDANGLDPVMPGAW